MNLVSIIPWNLNWSHTDHEDDPLPCNSPTQWCTVNFTTVLQTYPLILQCISFSRNPLITENVCLLQVVLQDNSQKKKIIIGIYPISVLKTLKLIGRLKVSCKFPVCRISLGGQSLPLNISGPPCLTSFSISECHYTHINIFIFLPRKCSNFALGTMTRCATNLKE